MGGKGSRPNDFIDVELSFLLLRKEMIQLFKRSVECSRSIINAIQRPCVIMQLRVYLLRITTSHQVFTSELLLWRNLRNILRLSMASHCSQRYVKKKTYCLNLMQMPQIMTQKKYMELKTFPPSSSSAKGKQRRNGVLPSLNPDTGRVDLYGSMELLKS